MNDTFPGLNGSQVGFLQEMIPMVEALIVKNPDNYLNVLDIFETFRLRAIHQLQIPFEMWNQIPLINPEWKYVLADIRDRSGRERIMKYYQSMNLKLAFKSFMSTLWYSKLPCFDVRGMTSSMNDVRGILKHCKWKRIAIPCSAIFTTTPTDQAMCCSFNKEFADDIFVTSEYTTLISGLQAYNKKNSFTQSDLPDWYLGRNEPKSQEGCTWDCQS